MTRFRAPIERGRAGGGLLRAGGVAFAELGGASLELGVWLRGLIGAGFARHRPGRRHIWNRPKHHRAYGHGAVLQPGTSLSTKPVDSIDR